MKLIVELNPDLQDDRDAMMRLFAPLIPGVADLADRCKEMSRVASELGKTIGEETKLTNSERGKVGAKTRWSKAKKKVHTTPPTAKKNREQDFSKSTEKSIADVPRQNGGGVFDVPMPDYPDGRELLEGTYPVPPPQEKDDDRPPAAVDDAIKEE